MAVDCGVLETLKAQVVAWRAALGTRLRPPRGPSNPITLARFDEIMRECYVPELRKPLGVDAPLRKAEVPKPLVCTASWGADLKKCCNRPNVPGRTICNVHGGAVPLVPSKDGFYKLAIPRYAEPWRLPEWGDDA